jgi:nitroreductase
MIHELISGRKSIRAFADKSVDDETLISLFDAARWAPSSRNEQPWRFIVAKREEPEAFEKILSCLHESNRVWAKHGSFLFITLAKKSFSDNNHENVYALHDTGLAIGNLSLQATSFGLYLHQMGGIDRNKTRLLFEVPDEFDVVSITVAGYKGNPDALPDHLREREFLLRTRKNLDEIIFSGKFGEQRLTK